MKTLKDKILHLPIVMKTMAFVNNLSFGKDNIPLVEVVQISLAEFRKDDVSGRASAVAFNFLMAIFPSIIFLFTLIPYIPIPNLEHLVMDYLYQILPQSIYVVASETIRDIIAKPRGGLLSFGFLFAWFAALNGTLAIIESFNKMYKTHERRGFIKKRIVAGLLIFLLAGVLITSMILLIVGQVVLDYLNDHTDFITDGKTLLMINLLRYGTVIVSFFFSI